MERMTMDTPRPAVTEDGTEVFERFAIVRVDAVGPERILASDGRERLFSTFAEAEGYASFAGGPGKYRIESVFVDREGLPAVRRIHT